MTRPNLLFLITDQQQAATTEPRSPCQMPYLRAVAERGTQFGRCYAANPICSPSRASLFTGLLPHAHGMVDCTHTVDSYRAELKPDLPFWLRTLQQEGYHTGYFGKWHIERSNRLENFGFDRYDLTRPFIFSDDGFTRTTSPAYLDHRRQLGLDDVAAEPAWQRLVQHKGYRDMAWYGVSDEPAEGTMPYFVYQQGIDFLQQAAQRPDQPWALFLSTEQPHDPYIVPREYYNRCADVKLSPPASFGDDLGDRPAIYRRLQQVWQEMDWSDFAEATRCYYALCSLIDDQIGRIVDTLESLGQLDNTVIVFVSDHGDFMGAHRLMTKGIPAFEEAYRVPCILTGPGIEAGNQRQEIVSMLDLGPTLIEHLTGKEFEGQGRSFTSLLSSDSCSWNNMAFAEMQGQRYAYQQRSLWLDNIKYVFNTFSDDELYDLASDPFEMENLAGDAAYGDVLESMSAKIWQIIHETSDFNMYQAQDCMYRWAPVGPEQRNL